MKKLLPLFITAALGSMATSAYADSITEIYELAKKNDPQLLAAEASKNAAFEAIDISRSTLLPQVNLTASYDINKVTAKGNNADYNQLGAGVGFSQELYNRASWVTLDQAEKTARQSDSSFAAVQQGLILRVASAYFEVLRAQDSLEFVRAEKAAVARQLEQTKQRFEVGLSAITDVHDAQAQFDSVLASEVLAENTLINSYESLREITGEQHDNLDVLDTERFSAQPTKASTDALIQEAEEKNLTLLAQKIAQDIAKDSIALASSGHLPSLTLDGGYNHSDVDKGINEGKTDAFNVGINLSVPLYSGGRTTAQTKQAEANYVAASQNLEQTYRSVVKEVRASNNNINATIGALKAYEQSVVSAESALEATEAGFEVGTRTIVDVLDSTRRLYDANRNLSNARYDYIISVLTLRQAVGTLSEQEILDINAGLKSAQ
ncbi:outer membrane channel protein TolC [Vibrio sp. SCSIO 43136]|uniref:outer membrane channel protein TolC n=1 Tax=Vibrio sp. SCSIO 43136 TaxID=2819101 RepID=UPI0020750DDB|nr:outer membrane channel protein TolC [Vibrio sp. SCSIO 43136]USD64902.1 outer membrane channel protein TolC [Vibrio sp. SCSIO 43136]